MSKFKICEIFKSIQGESTFAGSVCSFVRLSGCNLHCSYCDTEYAMSEFTEMNELDIINSVKSHHTTIVEITGGEPLLDNKTALLCESFHKLSYTVLVETNGSLDISVLPEGCRRIVDVKCPDSKEENSFFKKNISHLKNTDELKYVLSSRSDFEWALHHVKNNQLDTICPVIFSPNLKKVSAADCAAWIINSETTVRLGLQLHRLIWGDKRGV